MNTRSSAPAIPKANSGEPVLKYVQANGVRFAYLEQGNGPLVMFMHGFPDNAWSYRKQMQSSRMQDIAQSRRSYAAMRRPRFRRMEFSIPSRWARISKRLSRR
jgi:hypothetical protein